MFHPGRVAAYTRRVPVCQVCQNEFQKVAAFCPNCGVPLSALAARMREAQRRPPPTAEPPELEIVLPDLEEAEAEHEP